MKMCKTCWEAVERHFPLLTREEKLNILWCGTAFPAGCGEQVESQLKDLAAKSQSSYGWRMYEDAMRITHEEFDAIWEATRHLRPRWDEKEKRWIEPELVA